MRRFNCWISSFVVSWWFLVLTVPLSSISTVSARWINEVLIQTTPIDYIRYDSTQKKAENYKNFSQATTRYSPQTNQLQNGIPFPRYNNREGFSAYQIQICITKIYVQLSWFLVILWLNLKPYGNTESFRYYILLVITKPTGLQCIYSVQKLMSTNTFDTVLLPIQQYFLISYFPYFNRW